MKRRLLTLCLTLVLLLVFVPIVSLVIQAALVEDTVTAAITSGSVTLDGTLNETDWSTATATPFSEENGITGANVSVLWNSSTVYLAVKYGSATTISLQFGNTAWETIALSESISGTGLSGCANGGVAELAIDLAAISVVLEDYNEKHALGITLTDGAGNSASLDAECTLSAVKIVNTSYPMATGSGTVTHSDPNTNYSYLSTGNSDPGDVIDYTKTVQFGAKITITSLPAFEGNGYIASSKPVYEPYGLAFFLFRNTSVDAYAGKLYGGVMYNNGSSIIYRGYNGDLIDLGVKPRAPSFVLNYTLYPDGSADVFVDGVKKGSFSSTNAATYSVSKKKNVVHFRCRTPETEKTITASWSDIYINNLGEEELTLGKDMSKEAILDGITLTDLKNGNDFTLPASFETGVGAFDLTWTSDNEAVTLAKDGDVYKATVNQPSIKDDTTVNLKMSAKRSGGSGAEKVTWTTEATVEGLLKDEITNIIMQLGADESQMNFTWFSLSDAIGQVIFAKESELVGGEFPTGATAVSAARTESKKEGYVGNKATITGLEPGTTYYYILKNGDAKSKLTSFTTAKAGSSFSFAFAGDPQIGRGYGGDATQNYACIESDGILWQKTLDQMLNSAEFAGVDFLMTAGDQMNSYLESHDGHELQMDAFSNREGLNTIPLVSVLGNHEAEPYSIYNFHFNHPNMLTKPDGSYYGATYESRAPGKYLKSADYYFVYHNVLFLVLNSDTFNARNAAGEAADKAAALEHGEFVEKAISATSGLDLNWTIVLYHESPYGTSYHNGNGTDASGAWTRGEQYTFENMRKYLVPILYENGVDLVLSGHDHTYTRTHILKPDMEGGVYIDGSVMTSSYLTDENGKPYIVDPDGMLHITGASSTGSQINGVEYTTEYTAQSLKANTRQLVRIDITETTLKIVNYNLGTATTENITAVDTFTIVKTPKSSSFTSATVSLGTDLSMKYAVSLAEGESISDYSVRFTMNGKTVTVSDYVISGVNKYLFTFSGIAPQCAGDNIKAELLRGETVVDTKDNYSILANVTAILGETGDEKTKALIADLINYCKEAQDYRNYKTDAPVNTGITVAGSDALPTESDNVKNKTASTLPGVEITAAGVRFDYINQIYVRFTATSLDGITVKIGGENAEIIDLGDGKYTAYSAGISAVSFDNEVKIELCHNGTAVQTLTYSINSYAYAKYTLNENKTSPIAELTLALYRYGVSAKAYAGIN